MKRHRAYAKGFPFRVCSTTCFNQERLVKIVFALLICAILLNIAAFDVDARPAKKEIRIYLLVSDCSNNNFHCLEPVSRMVDSRSPAFGAMKALIAGPTAEEKSKGLNAPYTEYLSIKRLVITRGTAHVSLRTTRRGWARWPGDMAPGRVTAAIEK